MIEDQRAFQQGYYDRHYADRADVVREQLAHPLFRSFYDRLAERILDLSFDGELSRDRELRVHEAGCGEGFLGSALKRVAEARDWRIAYSGSDLSGAALELARPAMGDDLTTGDATEVAAALPTASQDLFVAKNLLHHLEDPAALLREAARAVGTGGRVAAVEARLGCPQFWVFSLLAPRRERYFFRGAGRNVDAFRDAGLRLLHAERFSWLPYELLFHIRFRIFRTLLGTDDPAAIRRVSRFDDRLAGALPWMASYVVYVAEPAGEGR